MDEETKDVKKDETKEIENTKSQETKEEITVDEAAIKKQGVSEYLKSLGVDTDTDDIGEIVKKHKEDEEKNSTELQKMQKELKKALKLLEEERKTSQYAQAQVEAIKLGAKPDLVDDLITIATAKVTEGKDIKKVISEIKAGSTGSVYFGSDDGAEEEGAKKRTVTRAGFGKNKEQSDDKGKKKTGSIAEQLLEENKKNRQRKSAWD